MILRSASFREVPLTKGLFAVVDVEDFEAVSRLSWQASKSCYCWYGVTTSKADARGKRSEIGMHRYIFECRGIDITGLQIDHKDRNGLNNRFSNLRVATPSQNCINQRKRKDNTSGFKGVHIHTPKYGAPRWRARLQVDGKRLHLGCFETPEDAAIAYNKAAIEYFGRFAELNEVS